MEQDQHQKEVTFGRFKNKPNLLFLKHVRIGPFAALYRPSPNLSGKDQYSATCIISEEQLDFLEGEMKKAAQALWKEKAKEIYAKLKPDFKAARMREDKYLGEYPSVKVTRNAKTEEGKPITPPKLKQKVYKGEPQKLCVEGEPGSVYDGCYVTLLCEAKAYDYKNTRGVKFDFVGMIFDKDGEPFVGRTSVSDDDLDELATEAEDFNPNTDDPTDESEGW